jgi:integrase
MHLTKRKIDAFQYQGEDNRRDIRWDDRLPGFGVRVYATGKKSFVVSYRCQGRKRLMVLGPYGVLTLDQAREKARQALLDSLAGNDPLERKQRAVEGETIADLCDAYLERHAKLHKKSWKDDERSIEKYILPQWSGMKARDLKRSDVAWLHRNTGDKHPYAANRLLELLSKMFELARIWGVIEETATNPARGIQRFKEKSRDRYVTHEELPRLMQAIDQDPNIYARYALWLYLLTGLRKSELLSREWADIDWNRKEIRVQETKNGRPHYLPLSSAALHVLTQIPKQYGCRYVFPGTIAGRHMVNIDKAWRRIRRAANVEDVRLHDLRRTVGSMLVQGGNSLYLVGKVLNHKTAKTTEVYARFADDSIRTALESLGNQIVGAAGQSSPAKVIPIRTIQNQR